MIRKLILAPLPLSLLSPPSRVQRHHARQQSWASSRKTSSGLAILPLETSEPAPLADCVKVDTERLTFHSHINRQTDSRKGDEIFDFFPN